MNLKERVDSALWFGYENPVIGVMVLILSGIVGVIFVVLFFIFFVPTPENPIEEKKIYHEKMQNIIQQEVGEENEYFFSAENKRLEERITHSFVVHTEVQSYVAKFKKDENNEPILLFIRKLG